MSPEQQRIAIAEVCGWRFTDNPVSYGRCAWPKGAHNIDDWIPVDCIPDYRSDLNAMHNAENGLSDDDFAKFYHTLTGMYLAITKGRTSMGKISAPAEQRAEAFLRTLNLWKD